LPWVNVPIGLLAVPLVLGRLDESFGRLGPIVGGTIVLGSLFADVLFFPQLLGRSGSRDDGQARVLTTPLWSSAEVNR
jgi:hypothetical protein